MDLETRDPTGTPGISTRDGGGEAERSNTPPRESRPGRLALLVSGTRDGTFGSRSRVPHTIEREVRYVWECSNADGIG